MKTLMVSVTAAGLAALWGCSQAPAKCGEVECKAICEKAAPPATAKPATPSAPAAPATAGLSTFEHSVLDPLLDDVRQGIRPWSDESVGICKGEGKECEEWVGTDVGELPEGRYMLRAEQRVPKYGALRSVGSPLATSVTSRLSGRSRCSTLPTAAGSGCSHR